MAAELILLTLDRDWLLALHKRAQQGDQEAIASIAATWNDYKDREIACFICDQPVDQSTPICMQILPEYNDDTKLIGAPVVSQFEL
jgi:hypothetical protein